MKAFISYSIKDKKHGAAVKTALSEINIETFLAHDDLQVSDEWARRIFKELKKSEIFVPLLSKSFKRSNWCGQEVGIAFTRATTLIIPLSIDGTLPYGFISHIQCHRIPPSGINSELLLEAVGKKWPAIVIEALLERVHRRANSFRSAEELIAPLVPYFQQFSREQSTRFARMAIDNNQIWPAQLCRDQYLPQFLKVNKKRIPSALFKALKHQVEEQTWYQGEES